MSRQDSDSGSRLLKPRFVACAILLLFLVILSMTVLVINRQCSDLKKQALASDSTVTSLLSEFVLEHEKGTIALLQSYAARPLLVDAVKGKDVAKTRSHLEGMKKISDDLDLTFITDKKGILWINYPVFPEAVGKDFSYRDWYKAVSSGWKPYISSVFKLIVADQPLAVAVCAPIFDSEGNVIGILANSQRLSFLAEALRRVPLQSYTKVTLLDRAGNIIYSNRLPHTAEITTYPFLSAVKEALQTGKSRIDIGGSRWEGSTVSATVRSIAPIAWTVVAEHTSKDVLSAGYPQFMTTAALSLLFFTAISLLLLYTRKQALLADTERLLMTERRISMEERQRQTQEKWLHSEMKYLHLHKSMIDGFVVTGMDGYIRECNRAYQHMLGYGPDEIMSLTYNDITPTQWHDLEKTIVEEQIIPKGYSEVYEKEYIRKDGTVFPVELRTYLIKDDKGSPTEMWAIVRDITERKATEDNIRQLNQELEQRVIERTAQLEAVNKELEAFSYSVSHDLRAPLRTINGFSQALLEDYGDKIDEEGKDHLLRIRRGSHKMGRLIDDLLNLSRVSRAEIRYDRVDLSALAREIADELIATNPERHVDLTIQDGLAAEGDPHLLRIAMRNLFDNAYKFSRNIPHAHIAFGMIAREGRPAYVVRDNGAGFDMLYAGRLFGAFQRLHTESEFEGTGIGLVTVQRIIHKHGGIVWAEGKVNDGASFFFTLWGGGT